MDEQKKNFKRRKTMLQMLSMDKKEFVKLAEQILKTKGVTMTAQEIAEEIMAKKFGDRWHRKHINALRIAKRLASRLCQFLGTKPHAQETRQRHGIALKFKEPHKYDKPLQFYIPKPGIEVVTRKRNSEQRNLSVYC